MRPSARRGLAQGCLVCQPDTMRTQSAVARLLLAAFSFSLCACSNVHPKQNTGPEQVHISWTGDPSTTMTVMWQTYGPTKDSVVWYGTSKKMSQKATGKSFTYEHGTGVQHEVTLTGLSPGQRYYYQVGKTGGAKSKVFSFRTKPKEVKAFTFTAWGDHGTTTMSRKNLKRVLADQPAFHLHLGDLSYANGYQPTWDHWFNLIEPLAATVPYMPTLGNHENEKIGGRRVGYTAYLARFALPEPETWYHFDYGDVRFIAFNSDDFANRKQLKWFKNLLKRTREDPTIRWVIVFQHHPLLSSSHRGINVPLTLALQPIFDQYGVDLILTGHDHLYERLYPVKGKEVFRAAYGSYRKGTAPVYVTSGGGGQSLYRFVGDPPEWSAFRKATYQYLRVRVTVGGSIRVESVETESGQVMDAFEIK